MNVGGLLLRWSAIISAGVWDKRGGGEMEGDELLPWGEREESLDLTGERVGKVATKVGWRKGKVAGDSIARIRD